VAGIFIPFSQQTSADLYADYFAPYPNVFEPSLRGASSLGGATAVTQRMEAFRAYEEADYEKAASLFASLLKENKEPGILLLLGNSNLAMNRTTEAKENFKDLITNFDDLDIQAKWFLSLCYLKEGQTLQARDLLEELGSTEISYATKANELLKKVD
jgi:tetratricopeptide (TPR) repeat protein